MNFLEKVSFLMQEQGLNKRTLSQKSGIPYTTISDWYNKGFENTRISTVKKLATYFDVTLDYLLLDEITDVNYGKDLSPSVKQTATASDKEISSSELHQKALMQLDKMNDEQIKAVLAFINSLEDIEKTFSSDA